MLPEKYLQRMKNLLGADYDSYISSLDAERKTAFHVNRVKSGVCNVPSLCGFETEKIPYCENGYYFKASKPGNTPLHHAGAFYIQEPAAMAPVASLEGRLNPGARILDVCAAPGGKTSQAANLCDDVSLVVSNEIVPSRCKTLVGNIERLGFLNSMVTNCDSLTLADMFHDCFDLVICDAPCSGEGMFRKSESAISDWSEENVKKCAERQREILRNASACVRSGGYLLYSTCTFAPEENEMNVSWFLDNFGEFSLCDPGDKFIALSSPGIDEYCRGFEASYVRRLYPHITGGEGQFFALFRKDSVDRCRGFAYSDASRKLTKSEKECCDRFLSETLGHSDLPLRVSGNNIFILDELIPVPARHVFSCGVKLGEIKSSRIVPHHQFFSAYGKEFVNKLGLSHDSEQVQKYLKGEGFEVDAPSGWCCVLVSGIPVGGGKIVDSFLKNHYPKGLRLM